MDQLGLDISRADHEKTKRVAQHGLCCRTLLALRLAFSREIVGAMHRWQRTNMEHWHAAGNSGSNSSVSRGCEPK